MTSVFKEPYLQDEAAAFVALEAIVWPQGPVCPHCGCMGRIAALKGVKDKKGRERLGLKKCYHCRKQFTVRVGTIFERSHVPLHVWFQAAFLMCSSKKGVSSNQLHRTLGVSLQTAWFMSHRLREAMRTGSLAPMGGAGRTVEADETFIGRKDGSVKRRGHGHKNAVLSLVDRESKQVRSFHVDGTSAADIVPIIKANVAKETAIMTDEGGHYFTLGDHFASHESVSHKADEYVRGDVHTNTVEGYYSIFKRGMKGVYQHCSERHLHRYLAEFDFRYSNRVKLGIDDLARMGKAMEGIIGKRLTYREPSAEWRASAP
ncbi:MAG: IS1595 family transposase [Methylocella sp.]